MRLDMDYYAVFGNHDGYPRGTVTFQKPFQAGTIAFGRYFFESQREWINEYFETSGTPEGHGFNHVDPVRFEDDDDRNDGYYAFLAGQGDLQVKMIVLNTMYEGVRNELHREGQTRADTLGLVAGNEVTSPIALEQGAMSEAQFAWLEGELADAAAKGLPALLFSHHPDRSFSDQRLGFPADGGKAAAEVGELLGRASFAGNPSTLLAWIAGHTHENVIRPCQPGDCPLGGGQVEVERGFWRVETASLIDYPQESRIVEVFDLCDAESNGPCALAPGERYALRLTMIRPDPNDEIANRSRELAIAEATCNLSQMLGGPLSDPPASPEAFQERMETIVTNAGEAAVQEKFCFGEESLSLAEGDPGDRDVILFP
jgi:hypothetical protein